MRTILELNNQETEEYFLKNSSYVNFDIPIYFNFEKMFSELLDEIWNKRMTDM